MNEIPIATSINIDHTTKIPTMVQCTKLKRTGASSEEEFEF